MASYHISNLGGSCGHIFTDLDGYVHTTAAEWMRAPLDAADGPLTRYQAEELARDSIEELEEAEQAFADWQQGPRNRHC